MFKAEVICVDDILFLTGVELNGYEPDIVKLRNNVKELLYGEKSNLFNPAGQDRLINVPGKLVMRYTFDGEYRNECENFLRMNRSISENSYKLKTIAPNEYELTISIRPWLMHKVFEYYTTSYDSRNMFILGLDDSRNMFILGLIMVIYKYVDYVFFLDLINKGIICKNNFDSAKYVLHDEALMDEHKFSYMGENYQILTSKFIFDKITSDGLLADKQLEDLYKHNMVIPVPDLFIFKEGKVWYYGNITRVIRTIRKDICKPNEMLGFETDEQLWIISNIVDGIGVFKEYLDFLPNSSLVELYKKYIGSDKNETMEKAKED